MIRDILMYALAVPGVILLCYLRVTFTQRQQKSQVPLQYNEKELKIRKISMILIIAGIVLALIPAKYAF